MGKDKRIKESDSYDEGNILKTNTLARIAREEKGKLSENRTQLCRKQVRRICEIMYGTVHTTQLQSTLNSSFLKKNSIMRRVC